MAEDKIEPAVSMTQLQEAQRAEILWLPWSSDPLGRGLALPVR
jgi:hypothetical protein